MYSIEVVSPEVSFSSQRRNVNRYAVGKYVGDDLSGIDIGKFFSRAFDIKGIVRKAPRMLVGATTGYLMGGGWSGAAAGAISAGAFKRQAGTSLFQDIYRGGLYGMIGGGVVGGAKVAMGMPSEAGLIGKGYNYIQETFFGPKPTTQYAEPIGPKPYEITEKQYSTPIGPVPQANVPSIQGPCIIAGECPIAKSSDMWGNVWEGTKKVISNGLPIVEKFGEKTLSYMTASQQAKAEQYKAQSAMIASDVASMMGPAYAGMGFSPSNLPMPGIPYSGAPSGVSSDITGGSAASGGGVAYPITPQEGPGGEEVSFVERVPTWAYVGGGAVLLYLILK
jgi:hypothetical protein